MMDHPVIEQVIAWLLTYAVHSTLLIALATLVAGRKSNLPLIVRDTIWKTALVGGIVTASLQHVAGIRPWISTPQSTPQEIAAVTIPSDIDVAVPSPVTQAAVDIAPLNITTSEDLAMQSSGAVQNAPAVQNARNVPIDWRIILFVVWMLGTTIGLVRLGLARLGLQRILAARSIVTELQLLNALTELRHRARINRQVHLTQSHNLPAAVALGDEICMPTRVFSELSLEHRKAMMAHEVAHIARRDSVWLTISLVIERVFFFQPFNRVARQQLHEIAEFLCDDWAVRYTGHQLTFAECLAEVAAWVLPGNAVSASAPSFAHQGSQLVRRVERVLAPNTGAEWGRGRVRAVAATLGLLVFGLSAPGFAIVDAAPALFDAPLEELQPTTPIAQPDEADSEVLLPSSQPTQGAVIASRETTTNVSANIASPESSAPANTTVAITESIVGDPVLASAEVKQDTVDARIVRSLVNALSDADAGVRREAVRALGELRATAAVPAVVNVLQDESTSLRRAAASALERMRDTRALPALTNALQDDSASVRIEVIDAIVAIIRSQEEDQRGQHRTTVGPSVASLLGDSDARVRRRAISAVSSLRLTGSVGALNTLTQDASALVRRSAILALGRMGDSTHVPIFVRALSDTVPEIRVAALEGIRKYSNVVRLSALTAALQDDKAEVRRAAAAVVARNGGPGAVSALRPLVQDGSPQVRATAIRALGQLGDRSAVSAIAAATTDSSADVREIAVRTLGELRDSSAFDAVRSLLNDPSAEVRVHAVRSLARVGGARAAEPVRPMLQDSNSEVREYAARVLGSLKDQGSVGALIEALSDTAADVRQHAIRALTEIKTPNAIDGMIAALADDDSDVRQYAVRGLSQFDDARVVDPLMRALQDGSSNVRTQAATALGRLRSVRARDALIAATEDPDAGVRRAAVRALSRIR